LLLCIVILLIATAFACNLATWRATFRDFRVAYPAAQALDFYKLAHQGTMGSEHAVSDPRSAQQWMTSEIATLTQMPHTAREPLLAPLPPAGRFVRVNLRPYVARGGSPDSLVTAFVRTANGATRDSAQLQCALEATKRGSAERALFEAKRLEGFPAVHHSERYTRRYAPAYRVVSRELAEALQQYLAKLSR
jgi:hypothetical protein